MSFLGRPLPTVRSRRLAPNKAGTGGGNGRPAHGGVSRMGTIWAGGSGRAGSCRSGRPGSPSPTCPGMVPACPRFLRAARGWGALAGLWGWADSFSLWALLPPGSFQTRGRGRGRFFPLPGSGPGPHLQPLCQIIPAPGSLCTAAPQWPGTLSLKSLWPKPEYPAMPLHTPPCP